jgi:phage terminase large subunit
MNVDYPYKFKYLDYYSRFKALYGGRGSGKSYNVAKSLLLRAFHSPIGLRILCGREKQNSIKESVKALLDDTIVRLKLEKYFRSTNNEITTVHNNSNFIFSGLYQKLNSIKSIEGIDICWIEEAHTLTEETLDILLPTIRKKGSQIWFTWNPTTLTDPIGKMFFDNPPKSTIKIKLNYYDNPWFPQELRDQMEYDKARDYNKFRHIWLGEPVVHTELQVFKNWKIDNFVTPEDIDFLYGADWGFSNDPTVLVRFWVVEEQRKIYIDYEAYGRGVEISDTPALFDQVPGSRDWPITADSARPEIISHMNNNGFNIMGAKKGAGSVESGVKWLQDYDIVVHERCKETISELALYSYKEHKDTKKPTPKLVDANNHLIDAIRYASEDLINNFNRKLKFIKIA